MTRGEPRGGEGGLAPDSPRRAGQHRQLEHRRGGPVLRMDRQHRKEARRHDGPMLDAASVPQPLDRAEQGARVLGRCFRVSPTAIGGCGSATSKSCANATRKNGRGASPSSSRRRRRTGCSATGTTHVCLGRMGACSRAHGFDVSRELKPCGGGARRGVRGCGTRAARRSIKASGSKEAADVPSHQWRSRPTLLSAPRIASRPAPTVSWQRSPRAEVGQSAPKRGPKPPTRASREVAPD